MCSTHVPRPLRGSLGFKGNDHSSWRLSLQALDAELLHRGGCGCYVCDGLVAVLEREICFHYLIALASIAALN